MPAIGVVRRRGARIADALALAFAMLFAAFIVWKGIPSLRHDWAWPTDRISIASFMSDALNGWLSTGFGTPNPHPTTYLFALPIGAAMWLFGPIAALGLLAIVIGYACMRCVAAAASQGESAWLAAVGIGLFALFNPWVYNEVVAGHLVMVLAYAGLIGLFAEMMRGGGASMIRLAAWIALIEVQLQFFILAMAALLVFAGATRKWLPPLVGTIVALPSIVGLVAERGALLRTPYSVEWQTNQSVSALPLLGLGGYFPGYADRLGIIASISVWIVLALAIVGAIAARRSRATIWTIVAAIAIYVAVLGLRGPIALPYAWLVRTVPESGVFRELYDLVGVFAALLALLACAATARFRALGYVALAAGLALPITWLLRPPSDLWVASAGYPHPEVVGAPFTRVALLPAFQPVGLRRGDGDGADPDVHIYPRRVATLNEYLPTYPVDMALARYEESGAVEMLRTLGVTQIIARPWLVSRARGGIGWAATSLESRRPFRHVAGIRYLAGATALVTECDAPRIVLFENRLGICDVFFGDAAGNAPILPVAAPADSIDPRNAWIDARLTFAEAPVLAQPIGGALTQSRLPQRVEPGLWLLAFVRGELRAVGGGTLARSAGSFIWLRVPSAVTSVTCAGLCELVAQTTALPDLLAHPAPPRTRDVDFYAVAPWFYVIDRHTDSVGLLRFNERYDAGWHAFAAGRALPHVRIDGSVNGWLLRSSSHHVILVQLTAIAQLIAEVIGAICVVWLLEALAYESTKRARWR